MPTIDEQVSWWVRQASHDLQIARSNKSQAFHDACALMSQQSAEKYLKALIIKMTAATPPKVHQCERLAKFLNAPNDVLDAALRLESGYMETRYPDAAMGVPYELFTESDSEDSIRAAELIEQWVLQKLNPNP